MAKKDLIDKINELVDEGVKKSYIEKECKLPKNSLASVLTRIKPMPVKWISKLEAFSKRPVVTLVEKTFPSRVVFKKPDASAYEGEELSRIVHDEIGVFPSADKADQNLVKLLQKLDDLEQKCLLLVQTNHTLEQAVIILKADKLALEDRLNKLQQEARKGPSLADVVMGHINKPTEDRAANIRDIKGGKGKKEGK